MISLDINDRAFNAIKNGTKKVEIRVNKINGSKDYSKIKKGDLIEFSNSFKEIMICRVLKNNWYKTIEQLLTSEGTKYTLSSTNDFEAGVKSINSIKGYTEGIGKNGVYAIHIKYIDN